jgi:hypothetical protein
LALDEVPEIHIGEFQLAAEPLDRRHSLLQEAFQRPHGGRIEEERRASVHEAKQILIRRCHHLRERLLSELLEVAGAPEVQAKRGKGEVGASVRTLPDRSVISLREKAGTSALLRRVPSSKSVVFRHIPPSESFEAAALSTE